MPFKPRSDQYEKFSEGTVKYSATKNTNLQGKTLRFFRTSLKKAPSEDLETVQTFTLDGAELGESEFTVDVVVTNDKGFSASDDLILTVSQATALDKVETARVSGYPVPTRNDLFVEAESIESAGNIQLIDMGSRLRQCNAEKTSGGLWRIDVQNLESGLYFLRLKNGKREILEKVIIK